MIAAYEVDQFKSPEALEAFADRRDAVNRAVGVLGLRGYRDGERPALGFGGGALAAQGIDTYIEDRPFDLDVVVMPPMFDRLRDEGHFADVFERDGVTHGMILRTDNLPLPVDVFTSENPSKLLPFTGGVQYRGFRTAATAEIDGVNWVVPGVIASTKSMSAAPRNRDLAQLIKAQVLVAHENHAVREDIMWILSVGSAVGKLLTPGPWVPALPSWVSQLVETDFAHPAFANIPRL